MIRKRGFYSYKIQYLKILHVSPALPMRPPEPLVQFVGMCSANAKNEIIGGSSVCLSYRP